MRIGLVIIFLFLFSCKEKKATQSTNQVEQLSTEVPIDSLIKGKLFIEDESKYSNSFIKSLKEFVRGDFSDTKYYLTENKIRLASDTNRYSNYEITFPSLPKIKTTYILRANKNGSLNELRLLQLNLTEVEFQILLKKDSTVVYSKKGIANLSSGFIMAGESYDDDETNEGYSVFNYLSDNPCAIWFGVGGTEDGLKGLIIEIPCEGELVSDLILKFPTLRQVK